MINLNVVVELTLETASDQILERKTRENYLCEPIVKGSELFVAQHRATAWLNLFWLGAVTAGVHDEESGI